MSALISNPVLKSLLRGVVVWSPFWIATTLVFGAIGLVYVVCLKDDTFLASQALLVRDEATGAVMRLGRFQSQTEMKAAQEVILEMAKNQQVVRDALVAAGPESSIAGWFSWGEYPTSYEIEHFANQSISVHAPKGTEFGVTEIIYLDVKAKTKERATKLNRGICDALEYRLQQVRTARADGVISELAHGRESARRELANATERLHEMEREAGSDLSDLRGLTDMIAGGSTSRAEFDQIKNEIRQAELTRQQLNSDRTLLRRASNDPTALMVAPSSLLNSQPGLKKLREGLVEAQLSGSQLTGKFTEDHPLMIASRSTQSSIVNRFSDELRASIAGVEADIALVDEKIERLQSQRTGAEERLSRLADSRAKYSNLVSEVKSRVSIVETAEREHAEANASRESSMSTSLLTRLDSPVVSDKPIGPGRSTIVILCTLSGLFFGLGVVFVATPIDSGPAFGRRWADQIRGRRESDRVTAQPPATTDTPAASILSSSSRRQSDVAAPSPSPPIPQLATPIAPVKHAPIGASVPTGNDTAPQTNASPPLESVQISPESSAELDQAFQELARLKASRPENRSDELSVQMRMEELKRFLTSQTTVQGSSPTASVRGDQIDTSDAPRTRPRHV